MADFSPYRPPTTKIHFLNKEYHVFLSFRGPDVRKTLADHLFESLSTAGVHAFLDKERLKRGKDVESTLERAIQDTDIHIPIFSRNYAESAWCLKEVTQMWKSNRLIIPLFYNVEPFDVRYPDNEKSAYAQAFEKHRIKGRYNTQTIAQWMKALQDVSCRSGWTMDATSGYEGKLVKRVVLDIIQTLDRVPLHVANYPVGIEKLKSGLMDLLHMGSKDDDDNGRVLTVGILGMGGIGKTTLAEAVFNRLYLAFEASSFVFDVRTRGRKFDGITELQREILKDLLKEDMEVRSVDHGKSLMTEFLGSKRILIVLDDVDKHKQLEALKGNWAGPGSRIIVTTRDQHILNVGQIDIVYKMEGLEGIEALELFSWHAFLRAFPDEKFERLSKRIVKACCGHPLSLEVLGAFLYDKDIRCWNEVLSTSESIRNDEIFETLKKGYDDLSYEEQRIFLEIACSYIGHETENVIEYWKSNFRWNAHTAVSNLQLKLLIGISDDNRFTMHDLLRDMGRAIVDRESALDRNTLRGRRAVSKIVGDANHEVNDEIGGDTVIHEVNDEKLASEYIHRVLQRARDFIKQILGRQYSQGIPPCSCLSIKSCYCCKKDRKPIKKLETETTAESSEITYSRPSTSEYKGKMVSFDQLTEFGLEDLLRASAEILGRGRFGSSYKAILEDGNVVVVKRLKTVHTSQRRRHFERHVELIGRLSHPNLVRLRASYYSSDEKLLIYECMSNGSLHSLLHGNVEGEKRILDWRSRKKIALTTARVLAFIHSHQLACGHIKSSNVLLDKSGNVRISDYCLGMLVSSSVRLRSGEYDASEEAEIRKKSQESDVHSFGVFLLEILSGKDPAGTVEEGIDDDLKWVQSIVELFDLKLMKSNNKEEMVKMLQIARLCVSQSPERRPDMSRVVRMIKDMRKRPN